MFASLMLILIVIKYGSCAPVITIIVFSIDVRFGQYFCFCCYFIVPAFIFAFNQYMHIYVIHYCSSCICTYLNNRFDIYLFY